MAKVVEEVDELKELDESSPREKIESELGDLLFAAVNLCRHYEVDPAIALHSTNSKFFSRFNYIEKEFASTGKKLSKDEFRLMDRLWNEAKSLEE